jgi:Fe-S oxidoreductase
VVLACPTCRKVFAHRLPEVETVFLYELIERHGLPAGHDAGAAPVSVFDPCSSRHDEALQGSVRVLVERAGYRNEELPFSGESAQCCGNGGHIYSANPDLMKSIATKRV